MDAGDDYREFRRLGMSKDAARRLAMRKGWDEELKQLRDGSNHYSDEEVKMAIVHSRQDIIQMCSDLGEVLTTQRRLVVRQNILLVILAVLTAIVAMGVGQ